MNNRQIGTGFINLDKLLRANEGNRLGEVTGRYIQNAGSRASEDINKAQQTFQTEADKARTDTEKNQSFIDETIGKVNAPQTQPISTGGYQPVSIPKGEGSTARGTTFGATTSNHFPSSTQNVNQPYMPTAAEERRFQNIIRGGYQGPKEIKDFDKTLASAQTGKDIGDLSKTGAGRKVLLSDMFGGANYTPGQRNLDAALLGQQTPQLAQARRTTQGLVQGAESAQNQAKTYSDYLQGRAGQFANQTIKQLETAQMPTSEQINVQVKNAMAQEAARKKAYDDAIKMLTPDTTTTGTKIADKDRAKQALDILKSGNYINQEQYDSLLGKEGSTGLVSSAEGLKADYLQQLRDRLKSTQAQNISRTGLADDLQAAKLNALQRLMGKSPQEAEFAPNRQKFQQGALTLDTEGFKTYVGQLQEEKRKADEAAKAAQGGASTAARGPQGPGMGQTIGGLAGTIGGAAIGGPVGGAIGGFVGSTIGGAVDSSIICTELYRQNKISHNEYARATLFGQKLDSETFSGYLTIATPIVYIMKRSDKFSNLFVGWAKAIAKHEPNTFTKCMMPIAKFVGKIKKIGLLNYAR